MQAICHSAYVESLTLSPSIVVDDEDPRGTGTGNIIDWSKAQDQDPDTKRLIEYVRANSKPSRRELGPNPLLRQFNTMKI